MNIDSLKNTPIEEIKFSVVDTETTGMFPTHNRVIDIGIVTVKNFRIESTWETLINPNQLVPYWITKITGISDHDLKGQRTFSHHSKHIASLLDKSVFVAHNKDFDYPFILQEFKKLNMPFNYPALCTVLLGRKLLPHLGGADLDTLSENFGIEIEGRHRALPDAYATALILIEFTNIAKDKHGAKNFFDLERLQRISVTRKFNDLKDISDSLFFEG